MAKEEMKKVSLRRGASYTFPGVGVFMKGQPRIITAEKAAKLPGDSFVISDVKKGKHEEALSETTEENAGDAGYASGDRGPVKGEFGNPASEENRPQPKHSKGGVVAPAKPAKSSKKSK